MMKKCAAILTLCLLLTGCKAQPSATPTQPTQPSQTQATVQPTEPPVAETVVTDHPECTVTILKVDPEGTFGYTLALLLENKTEMELMFSLSGVSVNGYMCDPYFAATVSAGMKANEKVSFPEKNLAANGITDVTDITFTLSVYDATDVLAEYLVEEEFTFYPQGEAAYRTYTRQPRETDRVLFDREECAMIVTGFDPESIWGYGMDVFLENRTDKTLMFSASDVAVNGFMCDPYWAVEVAPGKKCNTQLTWSKADLEDNGITQVETLQLPIRVYDSDNWMDGEIFSGTFTVTP